jgi:hypothetical protein
MRLDMANRRAKKLIYEYELTEDEVQQIVASARINLATFDPDYRANVSQLADELQKSRPTIYGWADRALLATINSLRNIRAGRPPKVTRSAHLAAPAAPGSTAPPGDSCKISTHTQALGEEE